MNRLEQEKSLFEQSKGNSEGISLSPLGSCQYTTIWETYQLCLGLIKLKGLKEFEKDFGISYSQVLTKEEFEKDLYTIIAEGPHFGEDSDDQYESFEAYVKGEYQNPSPELLKVLETKALPIKDYVEFTQNQAWDLWSAYPSCLVDLEIKAPVKTETFGPILNQLAQDENFEIGVELAYLKHYLNIDAEVFDGYDT